MKDGPPITLKVGVKPGLKALLEVAAAKQFRPLPDQIRKYLIDGLMADGYIQKGS